MGKTLGSWSGMRKFLEREMIVDSLQGRVRYDCTTHVGMDGCHEFEMYIDNRLIKRFSWETVNSYFIKMGYVTKTAPMSIRDYWDEYWDILEEHPMEARTEYTDEEFCEALEEYRNQNIQKSIRSENPVVTMFAILDRRTGKRMLEKIKVKVKLQPEWVQLIYQFRCESENPVYR